MRVAVTGASGFLGRHVVRALRARGASVIAISRHPDAALDPGVAPLALDIGNVGDSPHKTLGSPDVLIHLAWGGLPNYRSAAHMERELPLHSAFLASCIRSGLARLIVTGTCLEYGLQEGELAETTECSPTTAYASAKCALHQHLLALREGGDFGLGWLRLFYLYGDGQASTSLYSQLRAAVAAGAPEFDMSMGNQVRDFLAVETAASHIATLAMKHADAGMVNICSGRQQTVVQTVQSWLKAWEADIVLNRGKFPLPDYEPFAFWGNTRRLDSLLETT